MSNDLSSKLTDSRYNQQSSGMSFVTNSDQRGSAAYVAQQHREHHAQGGSVGHTNPMQQMMREQAGMGSRPPMSQSSTPRIKKRDYQAELDQRIAWQKQLSNQRKGEKTELAHLNPKEMAFLKANPGSVRDVTNSYKALAKKGQGDDTKLGRVSKKTARLLDQLIHHGHKEVNPRTGLREYKPPKEKWNWTDSSANPLNWCGKDNRTYGCTVIDSGDSTKGNFDKKHKVIPRSITKGTFNYGIDNPEDYPVRTQIGTGLGNCAVRNASSYKDYMTGNKKEYDEQGESDFNAFKAAELKKETDELNYFNPYLDKNLNKGLTKAKYSGNYTPEILLRLGISAKHYGDNSNITNIPDINNNNTFLRSNPSLPPSPEMEHVIARGLKKKVPVLASVRNKIINSNGEEENPGHALTFLRLHKKSPREYSADIADPNNKEVQKHVKILNGKFTSAGNDWDLRHSSTSLAIPSKKYQRNLDGFTQENKGVEVLKNKTEELKKNPVFKKANRFEKYTLEKKLLQEDE